MDCEVISDKKKVMNILLRVKFIEKHTLRESTYIICSPSMASIHTLQKVQNSSLRTLHLEDRNHPINKMHKEYKFLQVADIAEYTI